MFTNRPYLQLLEYNSAGCSGGIHRVSYFVLDVCAAGLYASVDLASNTFTLKQAYQPTCVICSLTLWENADLDVCSSPNTFMFHYIAPIQPSVYTEPASDLLTAVALAASPSSTRDCYAAVGSSVLSGWTINHDSEEVRPGPSARARILQE